MFNKLRILDCENLAENSIVFSSLHCWQLISVFTIKQNFIAWCDILTKVSSVFFFHLPPNTYDFLRYPIRCLHCNVPDPILLDVRGSVHHSTIHKEKFNKMQQCIKFVFIPYLYEAQHVSDDTPPIIRSLKLHWQSLVFHMWKVVGRVDGGPCQAHCSWHRPPSTRPKTFHI